MFFFQDIYLFIFNRFYMLSVLGVCSDKTLNPNCTRLDKKCKKNGECCSENCRQSFFSSGHCDWDDSILEVFDELKTKSINHYELQYQYTIRSSLEIT